MAKVEAKANVAKAKAKANAGEAKKASATKARVTEVKAKVAKASTHTPQNPKLSPTLNPNLESTKAQTNNTK